MKSKKRIKVTPINDSIFMAKIMLLRAMQILISAEKEISKDMKGHGPDCIAHAVVDSASDALLKESGKK
jgi:hypothetical protein